MWRCRPSLVKTVYIPFAASIASSNFGPDRSNHSCIFACFSVPSDSVSATSLGTASCKDSLSQLYIKMNKSRLDIR